MNQVRIDVVFLKLAVGIHFGSVSVVFSKTGAVLFFAKRPIREIIELFVDACPHWSFREIAEGGHMAPLFQPELVNPIVTEFLNSIDTSS